MSIAERKLVDVVEGARITGLSPSTLYKLSRQGRLRSYKVLGAVRFDVADLAALAVERPVHRFGGTDGAA